MFNEEFNQWAVDYFRKDGPNVNRAIPRVEMMRDLRESKNLPKGLVSTLDFDYQLCRFLALNGYQLNPEGVGKRTARGYLTCKVDGEMHECIYVKPLIGSTENL